MGSFFLILTLAVSVLQCSLGDQVRGVDPDKKQFYRPQSDFTCLDHSETIPFSLVNDDYCDCRDGSDEPGTSACTNGKFYCVNRGHQSLLLISSRVNDKICDCCDGSDEWDSGTSCPNVCEEMGKKAEEERRKQLELNAQGHSKKLEYAYQGRQKEEDSRALLIQKEEELKVQEIEVEQLASSRDAAEEPEKAAKEKHKKQWEEEKEAKKQAYNLEQARIGFEELDTNSDGYVSVDEMRTRFEFDDDSDGEVSEEEALEYLDNQSSVSFDTFYSSLWTNIADKCQFSRPTTPPTFPDDVSNQTPDEDEYEEDEEDEEEDVDENDEDDEDDVKEDEEQEYDEPTKLLIAAADVARAAFREAESKKNGIEQEIKDLKKYLDIDYGPEHEFSPLYEQCYEFTDREYTYKMCAFNKVTQRPKGGGRETNLGTWGKWNGPSIDPYSVMVYENGEKCWNGPSRSATITIKCGIEDQLLSASEPNRCEYAMDFSTPAVCKPVAHDTTHEEL